MTSGRYKSLKLLILLVVVVVAFFNIYKLLSNKMAEKKYDDITTNMLIIQKKVKMINGETLVNVENEGIIGTKISEIDNKSIKDLSINAGVSEEELEDYYMLYMSDFEKMGIINELKRPNSEEYLVNYKQSEVIYIKGINVDGKKMYKLSKILSKDEANEANEEKQEQENISNPEESSEESSTEVEE